MDREKITELALAAGFEEKLLANGEIGLREYVYDFANAVERRVVAEMQELLNAAIADIKHFEGQRDELLAACKKTLAENGHLADGKDCTLIHIKRAVKKVIGGA